MADAERPPVLWECMGAPGRGHKASLMHDTNLCEATRIADSEGLAAVSMHWLANGVGVGAMSPYRDVKTCEELVDQQWRGRYDPYLVGVLDQGAHPYLRRVVVDAEDFPDPDEVFDRRRDYVLDGLSTGLRLKG